jgi:crossover junction endodeoxyribonuclease RuvC
MIVIGFDPGLATLGFGVVEFGPSSTRVLDHGDIGEPGADASTAERLDRICQNVDFLMNKHAPDILGYEAQSGVQWGKEREGQDSHINLRQVHAVTGILRMAGNTALAEAIPIYTPQPSSIKVALLGKGSGHAEKNQVREGVRRLFGVSRCSSHDADAIATAVCALKQHRAVERAAAAAASVAARAR